MTVSGNDLLDKIPQWLKSLYHMENELRRAARNGLILRNEPCLWAVRRFLALRLFHGFVEMSARRGQMLCRLRCGRKENSSTLPLYSASAFHPSATNGQA